VAGDAFYEVVEGANRLEREHLGGRLVPK